MDHRQTPVARSRGSVIALPLLSALVIVLGLTIALTDRHSSFADEVGELDTAEVPNGWASLIEDASDEAGVPAPVLAAQIDVESNWQADAVSPAGAEGLSQFMPSTWGSYGRGGDPNNPADAIDGQGRYMGDLLEQAEASEISGDPLELALAGYNAGFGAVERYNGVPPYPETENYVESIRESTGDYELST